MQEKTILLNEAKPNRTKKNKDGRKCKGNSISMRKIRKSWTYRLKGSEK